MVSWRSRIARKHPDMKTPSTLAVVILSATAAFAASNLTADVVKARQSDMRAMAEASKTVNDYFVGKKPYNVAKFRAAADIIRKKAAMVGARFNDVVDAPNSDASPFIKVDRSKFQELARHLEAFATQVSASAERGNEMPTGMRMKPREIIEGGPFAKKSKLALDVSSYTSEHAFHMMLQTCTACHASFRMKR
jgi:cytochrome c556